MVADYYGVSNEIKFYKEIKWHGTNGEVPLDTPRCGFYNENPSCKPKGIIIIIIIIQNIHSSMYMTIGNMQ